MKKKILSFALVLALVFALAACGGNGSSDATDATDATGASNAELEKLVVGASSTPHAEILEQVKDALKDKGYDLEIVIYDDYILPNTALDDGELDANYFQHTPYLESFNAENGTSLSPAALIHYEPFGIYANGIDDLANLKEGATIIIPADDSNETRALLLLAQEGLIELPEGANASDGVTTLDVADNHGYNIVAVQAETVPAQLENSDEGSIAVINGNYALAAGLHVENALAIEDASGDAAQTYANVVAVRAGEEESPKTKALIEALQSDAVKQYIEETYNGAVVAIF